MIKLKKLIKENVWDRKFGDPLPTFKDVMGKHQQMEELLEYLEVYIIILR